MEKIIRENIIKDFGLDTLSPEEQEAVILGIGKIIYQNVMMRVVDGMDERDQDEFDKLMDEVNEGKKTQVQMMGFLEYKVANFNEIVAEEIAKFREESVKVMGEVSAHI